jgi:hypothetical protein
VDHRRRGRGGRRSRSGRDCPQRAHPCPDSLPGGTDFFSAGLHVRRTWRPQRVCVRVRLLLCRPERVLLGERIIVIVPGDVSADERVCICAYLPVAVRVPEHPILVRLPDPHPHPHPDLGLAYTHVPDADADADHIGTVVAEHTHIFGTYNFRTCLFGARVHDGEHSRVGAGIRFHVGSVNERCQCVAPGLDRSGSRP